jgi:hypothetical protein
VGEIIISEHECSDTVFSGRVENEGANLLASLRLASFGFHDGNILLGIFIVMGCSFVVNITYYRPNVELACE